MCPSGRSLRQGKVEKLQKVRVSALEIIHNLKFTGAFDVTLKSTLKFNTASKCRLNDPPSRSTAKVLIMKNSEERPVIGERPKQTYLETVTTDYKQWLAVVGTQIVLKSQGLFRSSLSLLIRRSK